MAELDIMTNISKAMDQRVNKFLFHVARICDDSPTGSVLHNGRSAFGVLQLASDELQFTMTYGIYSYDITFEGKIKDPETFNEDTDMGGLTVKTITCSGVGNPTYVEMPEE